MREDIEGPSKRCARAGGRHAILTVQTRNLVIDNVRVVLGDSVEERRGQVYVSRIDFERRILPLLRPDLAVGCPKIPHVIVLDPGHGGWAPGTENSALHLQEKTLTLDVALRLRAILGKSGWKVVLTRDRDIALAKTKEADLDARSEIAKTCRADVFVGIHFDADAVGRLSGSEIFSFAPAHQFATDDWQHGQVLASAEQGKNGVADAEVPANRQDLWNTILAHALYSRMIPALRTADLGERIAHWRVLGQLTCPAVLVEPAYISNPKEVLRVYSPAFRQHVAEALAAGLTSYANQIKAMNELPAAQPSSPDQSDARKNNEQ